MPFEPGAFRPPNLCDMTHPLKTSGSGSLTVAAL
jgi:hypothetical protein